MLSSVDIVPQLVANSIVAGAIYTLVALGFNLIYGATRFFNLAHGVVAAAGAYTVFALGRALYPASYPFAFAAAGVVVAGIIGALTDRLVYAPLRSRKASSMVLMVASLGVFTLIQAMLAILFTSQFQALSAGGLGGAVYEWGGAVITPVQAVIIVSGIVIAALLGYIMKRTLFGRAVAAVSDDSEVARMVGINTEAVIGKVMFIGSAIAGLAGILVGFDTGIEPTMGMNLLLKGVIGSIIGGVGSIWGGVMGSFMLGFAENFGIWKISGEWKDAIAFALLIAFLLARPQGIVKK
jgi:branched-chain amino acid transport system permease protein